MKKFRHALSFLLVFVMLFSTSVPAFATSFPTGNENSSVIVTDSGVYINDVYYTQEQFVQLLETAQEVETETGNQTRSAAAAALVAGPWYIPGIGQVIVTAAGAVLVAGAVIEVGSWIYNAVVEWFANRAVQKAYEEAKENGEPTDDHSTETDEKDFPTKSDPNSSKDLIQNGKVKRRRYYDKDGNADMDIDYSHGGTGHTFPHRHDWVNGVRGAAY